MNNISSNSSSNSYNYDNNGKIQNYYNYWWLYANNNIIIGLEITEDVLLRVIDIMKNNSTNNITVNQLMSYLTIIGIIITIVTMISLLLSIQLLSNNYHY